MSVEATTKRFEGKQKEEEEDEENLVLQSARANKRNLESRFASNDWQQQKLLSASTVSTSSVSSDLQPKGVAADGLWSGSREGNDQQVEEQVIAKHSAQHVSLQLNGYSKSSIVQEMLVDDESCSSRPRVRWIPTEQARGSGRGLSERKQSRLSAGERQQPEIGISNSVRPLSRRNFGREAQAKSQRLPGRSSDKVGARWVSRDGPLDEKLLHETSRLKHSRVGAQWIVQQEESIEAKIRGVEVKPKQNEGRIGAQWVTQQEQSIEVKVRQSDDSKTKLKEPRLGAQWVVQQEEAIEAKVRATAMSEDADALKKRGDLRSGAQWVSQQDEPSRTVEEKRVGQGPQWVPSEVAKQLDLNIERKRSGLSRVPMPQWINKKNGTQKVDETAKLGSIDETQPQRQVVADRNYIPTQQNNPRSGPSNIVIDDTTSMYTQETGHSTPTVRVRNSVQANTERPVFDEAIVTQNSDSSQTETIHLPSRGDIPLALNVHQQTPFDRHRMSGNPSSRILMNMMDDQGRTMTFSEMQNMWKRQGRCVRCGLVQTHKSVQSGRLSFRRQWEPMTEDGLVYEGWCLICHAVPELRKALQKEDIPDDLFRISESELRENNPMDLEDPYTSIVVASSSQKSPFQLLTTNPKFQICMGLCAFATLVLIVSIAVILTKPEPFEPPFPTAVPSLSPSTVLPSSSPTLIDWYQTGAFVPPPNESAESFGYTLNFDEHGDRLAVSAPLAHNRKGQVCVYSVSDSNDFEILGEPIVGDMEGDLLGLGMHLSQGGDRLALGYPGNNNGFVRIFSFSNGSNTWVQYGQTLVGPSILSSFGQAVSLNFDGNILVVGAPGYSSEQDRYQDGLVRVFKSNQETSTDPKWDQVGTDFTGESSGDRFGSSLSVDDNGAHFVVGAPKNSYKWKDAGRVYWFQRQENGEYQILQGLTEPSKQFVVNHVTGDGEGFQLGTKCDLSIDGSVFTTNAPRATMEGIRSAGMIETWSYDADQVKAKVGRPVHGSEVDEGLGSDFDVLRSNDMIAMTGRNQPNGDTGVVKVYSVSVGDWVQFGSTIHGPKVGDGEFLGARPAIAMSSKGIYLKGTVRLAVGYQSVVVDDETAKPMIVMYGFVGLIAEVDGHGGR